jgi:hypothetical protein
MLSYDARDFNIKAIELANQLGGLDVNPDPRDPYHNDQYDAFRHALLSAELTETFGKSIAKYIADNHEDVPGNPVAENNMDRWNNDVGRDEYEKWKIAKDSGQTTDSLPKWIFDRVKEGATINDLSDPRKWIEPEPTPDQITPWNAPIGINPDTTEGYQTATTSLRRDPLAIDLDNDGIETVGINPTTPILFDHNGDSIATATGWLKGDDGWLVRDVSGNGRIDSGLELFGVDTDITVNGTTRKATSGFEALAALDANGDHVFNAQDAAFTQLRIWRDLNQNGVSEANELSTLADEGITSINLAFTSTNTDLGNGNTVSGRAVVTRNGGTTEADQVAVGIDTTASNLNLAENPFYSTFPDTLPINVVAQGLPDMKGSGRVRTLREAMSLSDNRGSALA